MFIDISHKDYANYKVINFPDGKKVVGVRSIDSQELVASIYDYDLEEVVDRKLNLFGIDKEIQTIYIQLL